MLNYRHSNTTLNTFCTFHTPELAVYTTSNFIHSPTILRDTSHLARIYLFSRLYNQAILASLFYYDQKISD